MNTITGITKLAVYGALLGGIGAAALGIGTGLAQADAAGPAVTHQVQSYDRGDQEVVERGHPIPIHGDDSGTHIPGSVHTAPPASVGHPISADRGK
ncbi:hypothetical protein H7J51_00020 [Mycobacterium crocinum]|uniref:DUF2613 domain-containing protein n=1 Tax=Mycolicibacterium crocinum TaxID=388459 RepID=A0ABY3TDN1_9MYCO|nr:hypothetical protein [Mycolicibacterium crocinum]MCV7213670.1 hypothetical protein [Mycolicibacterium crocinum]ULN39563.1 hypothetical protein MI149_17625 [Mycolicibacterium crocinum]